MNREQRRRFERRYIANGIPADLAHKLALGAKVMELTGSKFVDGTRVMLNVKRILNKSDELSEKFKQWVDAHVDTVFEVKHWDRHPDSSIVQLLEDGVDTTWLFHESDLVRWGD